MIGLHARKTPRVALSPSRRPGISPLRRSSLIPFAVAEEQIQDLWVPAEMPGHRDWIPVLVMISGWRGVGKTLTMTMLGLIQRERYRMAGMRNWRLMSNYPVIGADVVDPKIVDQLATFDPRMSRSTVLVDELPSYFPNRKSLRSINVDFSTFIQQVRKRDIEIIFTAQVPLRVDVQITEQVDWYVIPEVFGPRRRFLRLYWFDFKGQYVGNGHKYWPPRKDEADIVKIYGPLDSVYGKYPTGQVIAPQWSGYRDDIIAQDDWDESKFVDAPDPEYLALMESQAKQPGASPGRAAAPAEVLPPPRTLAEFIERQGPQFNLKAVWGEAQQFLPATSTYKVFREAVKQCGYTVADSGYDAYRMG